MKNIEQIALEVADSLYGEYGTPFAGLRGVANRFATKFLSEYLAQQTPSSYQELADAFVLLWSSDDRAAWDKKAVEHFDALLAKVESGYLAPTAIPEGWQPISTAPKDGTLIIGFCNHEADEYRLGGGTKLTNYGCACEGYGHVDDGQHIVYWEPDSQEGSWEEGYYDVPGYWAAEGFDGECCANPTHWQPLPPPPGEKK